MISVYPRCYAARHPGTIVLFLVFDFFELTVEGFETEVNGFFKSVGGLVGYLFAFLGYAQADDGLFIEGCFGFYHTKRNLGAHHFGITAGQLLDFLVDERGQFLPMSKWMALMLVSIFSSFF